MICSCVCRPHCKQLVLAIIAVAAFIFIYEMLFHGMILGSVYQATAHLWRTEEAMQDYMGWLMLGQFLIATMFCYLYSFMRMCGGLQGGACFGLMVGLMMAGPHLITYAVQPIPTSLIGMWIAGGLLEAVLAGLIVAHIYKHDAAT